MARQLNRHAHSVTALSVHMVFVTKYRHACIMDDMLKRIREIIAKMCLKRGCILMDCQTDLGKRDHIHLLIDKHPNISESELAMALKTITSREIRKEFAEYLKQFYWKPVFWKRGYCAVSAGGASLDKLKEYMEAQGNAD